MIQPNLSVKNRVLYLAGLSLAAMFVLNVAFGNAVMQITFLGLPFNQLFIGFLLITLAIFGLIIIPTGYPIFLYIWIIFGLFIWLPVGFINHGIVAGRDATQLVDATVVILVFSIFSRMSSEDILKVCEKILLVGLTLEFLDRTALFQFTGVTVSSFFVVSFFGGTIGSSVITMASFWFGIIMRDNIKISSSRYMIILSFLLILLLQNRFLYVSFMFTSLVYIFVTKPRFLNKSLLKKFLYAFILLIIFELYIGSFVQYLLNMMPGDFIESRRLFKYGIENFSLAGILQHLGTGFGIENEIYSGAAGGVFQRLGWWYSLFVIMFSDTFTLLFGMGYGIPLTDLVGISVIREPHNSFISVFCRNGLILFLIWISFHLTVVWKTFYSLKKIFSNTPEYKLLLVGLLCIISTYICGLVEPAFENPPISIGTYMIIGLSMVMLGRLKRLRSFS